MSGLLPRTPSGGQTGDFTNLNVQTLTVSLAGFINALTANSMDVGSLDVNSLTTSTLNGDPNLNIVATIASVGGDTIVTATAAQTLTNKTLTAPIISTISNTGTLTLPTTTTTLVGTNTTDVLTNKKLVALNCFVVDNSDNTKHIAFDISGAGTGRTMTLLAAPTSTDKTITIPNATDTLVGKATTDILTNKTIDSAGTGNAITITSGSLVAENINNIINQRLKTSSAVAFGTVTTQNLLINTAINDAITVLSTTPQFNQITFQTTGPTNQTSFGYDNLNSLHRVWGYVNSPMVFATNNLERMRIPAGGIASDSSITQMLGLNGTTVSYKTININQDVSTSASPSFSALSLTSAATGLSQFNGKYTTVENSQQTTAATVITFATIPIATNTAYMIETNLMAYCTAGANIDTSSSQKLVTRAQQVGGTITGGTIQNSFSNSFATSLGHIASGTNILVQATGIASNTINWTAQVTVRTL